MKKKGSTTAAPEPEELALPESVEELRGHTPEELLQIIEALDVRLRNMHQTDENELRILTEPEEAAFKIGMGIRAQAMKMIEDHNEISKQLRLRPQAIESPYRTIKQGLGLDTRDVTRMGVAEARDMALRVLDTRGNAEHLEDDQKRQVEKLVRKSTNIARRVLVTENDDYRSAWQKLVTMPRAFLTDDEERAMMAWEEYRAAGEVTPAAGGFGIPVFIDPSIIMTAQGSGNPFLQLASQAEIRTNIWKGVSSAGVSWSFDTEASGVSDDAPTLAQPSVLVHMARGFIPYSIEVGMDYPQFAEEMQRILGEGYDELLIDKFSRGSGTGEPFGVITALDADTNVEVLLTTAGAFGEVDLYNVWKALPQRFRRKASWMMSVGANNAIRRFGTANVFHAFTVNLPAEWADFLAGKGVYESPYFSDVVNTTGHFNQVVVGDFSNYKIVRNGGMSVELVPTLFDITNNRPTGQRGWFAFARIGGNVVNNQGFRLLNQT